MFEKLLNSAFEAGGEVFVYMNGFNNPLKGRVQDIDGEYFTFFQSGKAGTILWAFRMSDVLSCGLLVGPPIQDAPILSNETDDVEAEGISYNESEN
jgi:hypothetical protein